MECKDRFQILSQYLDGELDDAGRRDVDEHLKRCAECRDELAAMRGVERRTERAIQALRVADEAGFVERVMRRLSGRRGPATPGAAFNWPMLIALIAATLVVVVAVTAFVVSRARRPHEPPGGGPHALMPIGKVADGSAPVDVEGRREGPGASIVVGSTVTAGVSGGAIVSACGEVFMAPASSVRMPTSEGQSPGNPFEAISGEMLIASGGRGTYVSAFGTLVALEADSSVYVNVDKRVTRAIRGWMRVTKAASGESSVLTAGVADDVRDFAPAWVPEKHLPNPWPCVGGSNRASGWTPGWGPHLVAENGMIGMAKVEEKDAAAMADAEGLPQVSRPDGTTARAVEDRVVVTNFQGRELKVVAVKATGAPVLLDDNEPVIATGPLLKRGDKVAGPLSEPLATGPAADRDGYAYAVGGEYVLGLGPEGESMRLKVPSLAQVRPTVTRSGEVYVGTAEAIWKIARGATALPEAPFAKLDSAPSCQMICDGQGRLYCATASGKLTAFSADGSKLFEKDLGSPAIGMAIGRGGALYVTCAGGIWKIAE